MWGAMLLEAYRKPKTKPKTIAELEQAFQVIFWDNLPQRPIDKAVKDRRLVLELTVDTSNIYSDNGILAYDH